MRKIILITAIALISSYSFGQLGFGIKGAVTMNSLSTDLSDYEKAAKTGYQLGAFVRLGKKLHIQPEAYFAIRSGELTTKVVGLDPNDMQNSVEVKQGMTLSTIDIPILIGYKILDPPTFNIRLQAGPVISMVVNKKFDVTLDGVDAPDEVTNTLEDDFNSANWGLQMGAGIDFLFLTLDVRYELGLSDLYKKSEANPVDYGGLKNNIFFISVGWKIL